MTAPAETARMPALAIAPGTAAGEVLHLAEGLSFWGGVDPATGRIIDAHHPRCGAALAGRIVAMPTSRGSCSGSGVLLELALNGHAPAALVFREDEEVLTLGALVAERMFGRNVPVLRLSPGAFAALAAAPEARIAADRITGPGLDLPVTPLGTAALALTDRDRRLLAGEAGRAPRLTMEILCTMAAAQGAPALVDVSRGHIDGCILHSPANLIFAETMMEMGARVAIPTTINAISIDYENWQRSGVAPDFGREARRLAEAYVRMGARPTFTCAPYLLEDPPARDEAIGWSESNAVIFANSVLGARTAKHPDYLDLCIALTGRAPLAGVYLAANRRARRVIEVALPAGIDDAFWPMLGWLAGQRAPDRIPLLVGLEAAAPTRDDLKALCAAFGTTSAAPMLHVAGQTPEADAPAAPDADRAALSAADLAAAWQALNTGGARVDLVAIGSPHASLEECRRLAALLEGRRCHPETATIVTLGQAIRAAARAEGLTDRLEAAGVRIIPDLCWCSITEPVFPPAARVLMTNSGKYAHYAPGLSGRQVRFGSLARCAEAAVTGMADGTPPDWLAA
ncbi:aconitase X [Paralimibaculum aggregatum]|uniref:Aconitase X n=1 Tax=Paralimibaculum aggregatum TaxID=3036245 RepID=A0ABQ6LQ81_9RHOB|nr:aconitase X [Limibaculum sp. NKW23]GMG83183.1 aconitase X [Limibaculum sp. NKW23]